MDIRLPVEAAVRQTERMIDVVMMDLATLAQIQIHALREKNMELYEQAAEKATMRRELLKRYEAMIARWQLALRI